MDTGTTRNPTIQAAHPANPAGHARPQATPGTTTRLKVVDTSVDIVRDIERAVRTVRGRHADLVDQLQRAAESVVLNLAEGAGRGGRDRLYHYRVAYASAGEAHTALQLLAVYGHLDAGKVASLQDRLDQVRAIAWRLVHNG